MLCMPLVFAACPLTGPKVRVVIDASPNSGPTPLTTTLKASVTDHTGSHLKFRDVTPWPAPEPPEPLTVKSYNWVFGDGETGKGAIITHTFIDPGAYDVKLSVFLSDGSMVKSSTTIIVETSNQPPVANAGLDANGKIGRAHV